MILHEAVRMFERLHDADPDTHGSNLALASRAYGESLQPRKSAHVINVPRPPLWTAPAKLVVSIVIGHRAQLGHRSFLASRYLSVLWVLPFYTE